jgi:serine/threonine protein kinase
VTPELARYEFVRRLGGGGMGDVYLAHKKGIGGFSKPVAIKLMRPDLATSPRAVELFLREGATLAALRHRNIVQVFELEQDTGALYLAMEYLEGVSLRALAAAHGGRLPYRAVAWIAREIARGLHAAHTSQLADAPNGVIHRDLSPSNVMACSDGAVKILDFGLARPAGQMPSVSSVEGKLAYLAPESIGGFPLDGRSDVYALGVMMYELLAGTLPFEDAGALALVSAIDAGELVPLTRRGVDVPSAMSNIVMRAMARDRGSRFATAKALEDALSPLVGSFDEDALRALVAAASTECQRDARPLQATSRRTSRAAVIVGSMLAAAAATGVIVVMSSRATTRTHGAATSADSASASSAVSTSGAASASSAGSTSGAASASGSGAAAATTSGAASGSASDGRSAPTPGPGSASTWQSATAAAMPASPPSAPGPATTSSRPTTSKRDRKRRERSSTTTSSPRSTSTVQTAPSTPAIKTRPPHAEAPARTPTAPPTGASPGTLLDPFAK